MKKALLILSCSLLSVLVNAQTWAFAELDINSVKAGINSNGDLFWDYTNPAFEVPQVVTRFMLRQCGSVESTQEVNCT
jgi:hypothetical protein